MSVQNTTPSQPGTSSQPTTQPEVPEPPIFTKFQRNSVNSTKIIATVEPARVTPLPTISTSISSLDVFAV